MPGPLDGIRVLELTDDLSGAFCGKMFAGFGADVVLVERPRAGNAVRWQPPFLDDISGPERGGLFLYTATGKRSLTLDSASPDGREIFTRLIARADLLIEDGDDQAAASGALSGAGKINPRLVRVKLRKWSPGPYENYSATELQLGAMGGWAVQVGEPGRPPMLSNSRTMTAFVPGLMGAIAGFAAVLSARKSGKGTTVDLSAHEALLFNTRFNETYYAYTGFEIKRNGTSFAGWSPTYRVFEAADGYVSCAASTDAQVELFLQLAGVDLEGFETRELRYERATELVARLTAWTRSKTKDEIFHEAQQWRIPMGKVSTIDEVTGLEQLVDRRFFEEVDHPVAGRRTYPGIPALFTGTGRPTVGRAPILGEHSAEIIRELGYSDEDVLALRNMGIV
ncbi:MAG: CoA transferase [Candidatus Binataceae bacterium]|jgi:crotonobetainyl-CoA:carnitine CoA-transferase CaiB-like acyl-CoA transferase